MQRAGRAFRVHDVLVATTQERGRDTIARQAIAVKAAEHGAGSCELHRARMLRCLPGGVLRCVAARATCCADEGRVFVCRRAATCPRDRGSAGEQCQREDRQVREIAWVAFFLGSPVHEVSLPRAKAIRLPG